MGISCQIKSVSCFGLNFLGNNLGRETRTLKIKNEKGTKKVNV